MSTGFRPGDRIQITDPSHPHFPRHGEFRGYEKMWTSNEVMARLQLDPGPGIGGEDGCYASQRQFMAEQLTAPKLPTRKDKRWRK